MPAHRLTEYMAILRRIVWQSDDGSFAILSVESVDGDGPKSALGSVTAGDLIIGLQYRFYGRVENSGDYGPQFKFNTYKADSPSTPLGIVGYMQRTIQGCGIGEVTVRRAIDLYGIENCIATFRTQPDRIKADFPRVNADRVSLLLIEDERFQQTKVELADLFHGRGFPGELITKSIERFGNVAADRIKRDPWTLLVNRMPGCGFLRVDKLYLDLGHPSDRLKRQVACAWNYMRTSHDGHVWFSLQEVAEEMGRSITGQCRAKKALKLGLRAGIFSKEKRGEQTWISIAADATNEVEIAERLLAIQRGPAASSRVKNSGRTSTDSLAS